MISEKDNKWIWDIVFTLLGCMAGLFLLWKCRYGFANMDETFYLLTPYRLTQGDGLFAQEWHLSQMSSFLLYPVMKFYFMFGGEFEALFLNFRYIYTIIHVLICAFIYIRFRLTCRSGATAASLALMLYAPFGLMALSYNSLGIDCLAVALTILVTAKRAKHVQEALAGFIFAAAVLCCPYLLLVYAAFLIASIVVSIVKKRAGKEQDTIFNIKCLISFTIGAAVLAVIFAAFVLSRASFAQVMESLPHILNDPSHEPKGLFSLVISYFASILALSKAADLSYALLIALFVMALVDRKSKERSLLYLAAAAVLTIVALVFNVWYGTYINYVMFPISFMAPVCFAVNRTDTVKKLFFAFWIPAMIYTFCIHATSNMEYYAISSASAAAIIPSILIIAICARDFGRRKKNMVGLAAVAIAVVLCACQIGTIAVMRYRAVFWSSMEELAAVPEKEGLQAGLYISGDAKKQYDMTREVSACIEELCPGEANLLAVSYHNSVYLQCPEKKNASISGWLLELDDTLSRSTRDKLLEYYKMNPQKIPDVVLIDEPFKDFMDDLNTVADYEIAKEDWGACILLRKQ